MAYNPRDFYFKKAKEQNYAARSIFKLEEINNKLRIIKASQKILDLGCAPGSWSQYASKQVGARGKVLGIDLSRVGLTLGNANFIQGDAFDEQFMSRWMETEGVEEFDVVLSDMAPKTTGIRITDQERSFQLCKRALEVAEKRLKVGGHFVVKIFQGDEFKNFTMLVKERFEKMEISRPKSVRKESFEIYVIGLGLIKK